MKIGELRKKMIELIGQRQKYEQIIVNRDVLLEGKYREFYKTCGNKNCRCAAEGIKHGPYHKIEVFRNGRQKVYIVPKDKVSKVISLYENRKRFIHAVEKAKEINAEIFKGIAEIKKEKEKRVDKTWLK